MYPALRPRPGLFVTLMLVALAGFLAGCLVPAEGQEAPACHEGDVTLDVRETGILVEWPEQQSVIVHNIFRKASGEDTFVQIGQAPSFTSSYLDENASRGTTYTYRVVVKFDTTGPGTGTSAFCEEPTATAIPFFPSTLAWGGAAIGAVVLYAHLRRR